MRPTLGLVEGFYGRPWTWAERLETVRSLAPHGYRFHVHAPKAARWLRRDWRSPVTATERDAVAAHAAACRSLGVQFGLGLSPHEFDAGSSSPDWRHLDDRLDLFAEIGAPLVALLFDDIRGDDPTLAGRQRRVIEHCLVHGGARSLWVCPTYYSDDPVLDRVFGTRPPDYLERLTADLDPAVGVFWTGPEVCSREISPSHLQAVCARLGRKPLLWDNYPVNDGPRMSQVLHLRAFVGRPATLAQHLTAHAINPALQPTLTRIPALTLADRYRSGEAVWCGSRAFAEAAREVLGNALAARVREDLIALQDTGRDRLGERAAELRARYGKETHAGAREIVAWLDGAYEITDEIVRTQ